MVDTDSPLPSASADLPCAAAVEFMADVFEAGGDRESVYKAVELWKVLANELDTIRKKCVSVFSRSVSSFGLCGSQLQRRLAAGVGVVYHDQSHH